MVTIYTNEDGCSSFGVPAEWANFPEVDYCEGILPSLHWSEGGSILTGFWLTARTPDKAWTFELSGSASMSDIDGHVQAIYYIPHGDYIAGLIWIESMVEFLAKQEKYNKRG